MLKILNWIFEFIGWLLIVASPSLIGTGIGALIYLSNPTKMSFEIAVFISVCGLVLGIIWATKIWKNKGTISFLSKGLVMPEIDDDED
ncbi:MAG: hypothetical protein ACSHXL_02700 [Bacteroidota bacterium]